MLEVKLYATAADTIKKEEYDAYKTNLGYVYMKEREKRMKYTETERDLRTVFRPSAIRKDKIFLSTIILQPPKPP